MHMSPKAFVIYWQSGSNQYGIKSDTTGSELSRWEKSVKRTKKALKMAREYTDRREAQVVGEYEAAK